MMITRIHVNQHVLAKNRKTGAGNPAVTTKDYKRNRYGNKASISVGGYTVLSVIQSPDGTSVWIETGSGGNLEVVYPPTGNVVFHHPMRISVSKACIRRNISSDVTYPILKVTPATDPIASCEYYVHEAVVYAKGSDDPAARIMYRPDKPLSCGARVWVETKHPVEVWNDQSTSLHATGG